MSLPHSVALTNNIPTQGMSSSPKGISYAPQWSLGFTKLLIDNLRKVYGVIICLIC